jgi:thioredoxin 1
MEDQVKFVKVNVDDEPDLAQQYSISSLPTLKFFCDGREIGEIVGAPPKPQLEKAIRDMVSGHNECLASSSPMKT